MEVVLKVSIVSGPMVTVLVPLFSSSTRVPVADIFIAWLHWIHNLVMPTCSQTCECLTVPNARCTLILGMRKCFFRAQQK